MDDLGSGGEERSNRFNTDVSGGMAVNDGISGGGENYVW